MEGERITVVTGGAGFIGSHLVGMLVDRGERVRVVERPGAPVDHLPPGVEIATADVRDVPAVQRALEGAHHVYHLAANPRLWARDRREFDVVNHQGTVHVLDAAIQAGARRIVHVSTESILTRARDRIQRSKRNDGNDGDRPLIDENVVIEESDTVGPYCLSKLRAEEAAMARAREGHPVLIANPTMPIGPGDRGLSPPTRLILDMARGSLPALMDCTLNLIDVRDSAEGLIRVLDRGRPGRRYLLAGRNLTLVELFEQVASITGSRVPRLRVPYPLGLAVAVVSEWWADHVSGQVPRASTTGVRLARRIMHFDPSRTRNELELAPRPIDQALAAAIEWFRLQGWLDARPADVAENSQAIRAIP